MSRRESEGRVVRVVGAERAEAERLVALVRRFHGESGREVGPAQAQAIQALCANASLGRAWLLTDACQDAGYALAYWRHSIDHGGRVAVLDDLWIDTAFRGSGLGRRLLEATLADMAETGARAVLLDAEPTNVLALALYRRLGFAPKGTALFMKALNTESAGER